MSKEECPFSVGQPLPVEYFVGRSEELKRLDRALSRAKEGRPECIFLTGERGIGKSSLASLMRHVGRTNYQFAGAHCFLGGVRDLDEFSRMVFQRLLQELPQKTLLERVKKVFGRYLKSVNLFGISVELAAEPEQRRELRENFLPVLRATAKVLQPELNGVVLILDDLNGITQVAEFAHFLKSVIDEIATGGGKGLRIVVFLVGVRERMDDLGKHQPSIARIFDVVELPLMREKEATEVFEKGFERVGHRVEAEAMEIMVQYSGGLPVMLHEVGQAVFYEDTDEVISKEDALAGVLAAADSVGQKYLERQVYNAIRTETYRSMLRRISRMPLGRTFRRSEIMNQLADDKQKKNFDNFLTKMVDLNVLRRTGATPGEYGFTLDLYRVYAVLEALRAEPRAKR